MARRPPPPLVLFLVGLFAIAAALAIAAILWNGWLLQRRAATGFVRTPGTVLEVGVEAVEHRSGRRRNQVSWAVEFHYGYDIGGRRYTGDRGYFLGSRFQSREDAEAHARAHPVGSAIDVFVDPEDPSRSVLDTTPPDWWPLLLPLAPLAFGAACLWYWRRLVAQQRVGAPPGGRRGPA